MYCGNCGAEVRSAFCNVCGARAVQPETVQTAATPRTFAERHQFGTVVMTAAVCFVALLIVVAKIMPADPPKYGRTKIGSVCAKSAEDVWSVLNAYQNQDARALQGLIMRGQALELD